MNKRTIIAIKKMMELGIPLWEGVPSEVIDEWVKEAANGSCANK